MSPAAFERRVTWWFHRFSATHRQIASAPREELSLEPVHDEVYRETYWLLRSPFGAFVCYPDSALAKLLPREFDLERRILRLDDDGFSEWKTFLRTRPNLEEKIARLEMLEARMRSPPTDAAAAPDAVS